MKQHQLVKATFLEHASLKSIQFQEDQNKGDTPCPDTSNPTNLLKL